jgi:hypothetical protein
MAPDAAKARRLGPKAAASGARGVVELHGTAHI